jgi:hypothetical protein
MNNIVSDDLTAAEKQAISNAAATVLQGNWGSFVR